MACTRIGLAAGLGAVALVGAATAQDAIKARQAEFKELGRRMGAIKDTVIDRKGGSMADVAAHAQSIAGKIPQIPSWFPPGSDQGESRARPAIWHSFADVEAKARNAQGLAQALLVAARGGDRDGPRQPRQGGLRRLPSAVPPAGEVTP